MFFLEQGGKMVMMQFPAGIVQINRDTFQGQCPVGSMYVPSGVKKIASFTFWSCVDLKEVHLPREIEIASAAFFPGVTIFIDELNFQYKLERAWDNSRQDEKCINEILQMSPDSFGPNVLSGSNRVPYPDSENLRKAIVYACFTKPLISVLKEKLKKCVNRFNLSGLTYHDNPWIADIEALYSEALRQ